MGCSYTASNSSGNHEHATTLAGVSRSATVVMSYLLAKKHFHLHEAFFHVLSKRPIVCPNLGFMEQLCSYEQRLHGICTIEFYRYTDWYVADSASRPAIPDLNA
eukprot:GHVT01064945.1.p2 GENE.GHVT01064945.1~~GHVT01064945.1.p2  ORF type:complete len:104 (+),score=12.43 GHVT01064945.1:943-1254(+)